MNILITGGAGFVGSNLCIHLKSKYNNYKITAFDNLKRRGSELNINRLKEAGVEFIHGDVRNSEDFSEIKDANVIIDASADPSVLSGINSSVYSVFSNNLLGTINCLELANKLKADFIFLSTSRVYPIKELEGCNYEELDTRFQWIDKQEKKGVSSQGVTEEFTVIGSRSFYGSSKLASELLIQEYNALKGMRTIVNRCGVISGPWQMGKIDQGVLVLWLARHFYKGELNYIGYEGKGKQLRDVIHIKDISDLIDWQIHHIDKVQGHTFNVGGGLDISFSLLELTEICREMTGNQININVINENRLADIRIYVTDNTRINNITGWKPNNSLRHLIEDTYCWIKDNETQLKNILQ